MEVEPHSGSFWLGEWYVVMGETIGKVEAGVAGNQVSGGVELIDHARPLTIALSPRIWLWRGKRHRGSGEAGSSLAPRLR